MNIFPEFPSYRYFLINVFDAYYFYNKFYECIYCLDTTVQRDKIILPRHDAFCRFCQSAEGDVSFQNKAHAIPESIGNKSIFTQYECDSCNTYFGLGIENDFGNWSRPIRLMARRKGKKKYPKISRNNDKEKWSINSSSEKISINSDSDSEMIHIDKNKKA